MLTFVLGAGLALAACFAGRWLAARAFGVKDALFVVGGARAFEGSHGGWAAVFAAGPLATYLACCALFFGGRVASPEVTLDETSMRVTVTADGPADEAGIRDGDRVLDVDGAPMRSWPELREAVAKGRGEIVVTVERAGQRLAKRVTPTDGKIRVGPPVTTRARTVGEALGGALVAPFTEPVAFVGSMLRHLTSSEKVELAGPVAIVRAVGGPRGGAFVLGLLGTWASCFLWLPVLVSLFMTPRPKR